MGADLLLNQNLLVIAPVILAALILVTTMGYAMGKRHAKLPYPLPEKREKTAGTITGAMLALLGFMLAISISMADSHFEARRRLVLDEANAIGTSRLRAMAIGGPHGTEIVRLLKDYARVRIDFFSAGEDPTRLKSVYKRTFDLQQLLWNHACAIATPAPTPISALLLSSLNEVFDLATSRRWALEVRIPLYVINLLLAFSLLSMGMMGYYFGICGVRHRILSALLFAAFTIAILLVMDLNNPRGGYVKPEQSPLLWLVDDMSQDVPATR